MFPGMRKLESQLSGIWFGPIVYPVASLGCLQRSAAILAKYNLNSFFSLNLFRLEGF